MKIHIAAGLIVWGLALIAVGAFLYFRPTRWEPRSSACEPPASGTALIVAGIAVASS